MLKCISDSLDVFKMWFSIVSKLFGVAWGVSTVRHQPDII